MTEDLSQLWWVFAIKGFVSVAFGYLCYLLSSAVSSVVLRPLGYLYLLVFFSLYICMCGIILLVGAIYAFDFKLHHGRSLLVSAIAHLAIGIALMATFGFGFSFSALVVLFGLHAAVIGLIYATMVLEQWRRRDRASWILGLAAAVSILAGAYLIFDRFISPDKLLLTGALYTAVFGLLLLSLAVDLRVTHRSRL